MEPDDTNATTDQGVAAPPTGGPAATVVTHRGDEGTEGGEVPPVPARRGAAAGVVAAGMALGVGELVSAFGSASQSLVGSVGNEVIERAGGAIVRAAISTLGTNDKPALVAGIVVICLVAGALLGWATTRRSWAGPIGFAAFGVLGIVAGLRDPQTSPGVVVLAAVLGTAAGIGTLRLLLRVARTGQPVATTRSRHETPIDPHHNRREFMGWAGGMGAFAAALAWGGKSLSGRSAAEAARARVALPAPKPGASLGSVPTGDPMADLTPYITPSRSFYKIDTALLTPQIDPANWTLKVTGMVDHPYELTFDQLLALPQVEELVTLSCVSNEVGGDLVGNARWQGVPLATILERAGVQPGATQIVGVSEDGWTAGFPTSTLADGRVALVAVGMNGEPLPLDHGFPARLVVAGLYGYVSATKWLREIRLTTWEGFDGFWIDKGWSKSGPIKTQSRIDVPRRGAVVKAGRVPIAGVAWAPTRGIRRVEVQVSGEPWRDATLLDSASDNTWRQWMLEWDAQPGSYQLRVRATDGTGETQVETISPPEPNGATGWHTRSVTVEA